MGGGLSVIHAASGTPKPNGGAAPPGCLFINAKLVAGLAAPPKDDEEIHPLAAARISNFSTPPFPET